MSKEKAMGFLDHLEELRKRLIKATISIFLFSGIAFAFSEQLIEFIQIPLGDVQMYNIAVTGAFYAFLKISLIAGFIASAPVFFYQAWSFVSPGLYIKEKLFIIPLVIISTLLFILGAGFCFLVVLPLSIDFLTGFARELVINTITIGSYISFAGMMMMAFGFGFQMPVAAYFLGKSGIVNARMMSKGRRYALVGILIASAIITPPDVFTQIMLSIPLYVLYEISILVVRVTGRKK